MASEREVSERWARYKGSLSRASAAYAQKFANVKFLLEPEIRDQVKEYCEREGMSLAEFMRQAIALRLNG